MIKSKAFLISVVLLLFGTIGVAGWWVTRELPPHTLRINNHQFVITVAQTPAEQERGLAGVTNLEPNHGMLFPLEGQSASFWMKGMLIDLDIIWIKGNRVVGIDHAVPAPPHNTPDSDLPSYPSPVTEPQAVFEIAAGQAKELGISVGDTVFWREGK